MALAVDGSSPAAVVNALATTTTAGFTPPSNSLIVAFVMADANDGSTNEACTVTSTGGLSWGLAVRANGADGNPTTVEVWSAPCVSSPGSITVSVTDNKGSVDKRLYVRVYTDGGSIPAGIGATNTSTAQSVAYTSTVANSWGWAVGLGPGGLAVAGSGQTLQDFDTSFDGGDGTWVIDQNTTTATPGSTVTMSVTSPASVVQHAAAEILPAAAGGAAVPFNPQRSVQSRDTGEVQWIQKDRRNALLVATAANDLAAPLLVPEHQRSIYGHSVYRDRRMVPQQPFRRQTALVATAANDLAQPLFQPAGARYWHLYNDTATRDRNPRPQQRSYVSDPSLLTPAVAMPAPAPPRVTQPRDYGEAQWLQGQRRDPLLLTTALLENELLGGAETGKRTNVPATHADRREVPQQRIYYDISLLATALLEGPLVVGSYRQIIVDRREVPQQRTYYDPSLLTPAALDPLTVAYGAGGVYWHLYNDQRDRREVPQQRAYISDPSFYPTVAPTDPLTVAWGSGGNYWHLYNDVRVERRLVPQQRQYESDPGLLSTAQLDELLGSADTAKRYLQAATHADRREVPQQRTYYDPSLLLTALLESPLLFVRPQQYVDRRNAPAQPRWFDPSLLTPIVTDVLAADIWRRLLPATHADRRGAQTQPPRPTLYFDAGPGSPPLTLAWGVGGHYWHLYNQAAELVVRWWMPQQRDLLMAPSEGTLANRPVVILRTRAGQDTDVTPARSTTPGGFGHSTHTTPPRRAT